MADEVVRATPEMIEAVCAKARDEDREEYRLAGEPDLPVAVQKMQELSPVTWCAMSGGVPLAVYGIVPQSHLRHRGFPWLLASKDVDGPLGKTFLRHGRAELKRFARGYGHLEGLVWAENHVAVRWLRWVGFTVGGSVPVGGAEFHRFTMEL